MPVHKCPHCTCVSPTKRIAAREAFMVDQSELDDGVRPKGWEQPKTFVRCAYYVFRKGSESYWKFQITGRSVDVCTLRVAALGREEGYGPSVGYHICTMTVDELAAILPRCSTTTAGADEACTCGSLVAIGLRTCADHRAEVRPPQNRLELATKTKVAAALYLFGGVSFDAIRSEMKMSRSAMHRVRRLAASVIERNFTSGPDGDHDYLARQCVSPKMAAWLVSDSGGAAPGTVAPDEYTRRLNAAYMRRLNA